MKEIKWVVGINLAFFLLISFAVYFDCKTRDCEDFQYGLRMIMIIVLQGGGCLLAGMIASFTKSDKMAKAFTIAALAIVVLGFSFCGITKHEMKPVDRMKGELKQDISPKT